MVAHPRLIPHCGNIYVGTRHLDFRRENNSTPEVLIKEMQ